MADQYSKKLRNKKCENFPEKIRKFREKIQKLKMRKFIKKDKIQLCWTFGFRDNIVRKFFFREISLWLRIFRFIHLCEKMRNFAKKLARYEGKFSHFFVKRFVRWIPYLQPKAVDLRYFKLKHSVKANSLTFKYFTPLGCKDTGLRKSLWWYKFLKKCWIIYSTNFSIKTSWRL